jgi:hypothetical protein
MQRKLSTPTRRYQNATTTTTTTTTTTIIIIIIIIIIISCEDLKFGSDSNK